MKSIVKQELRSVHKEVDVTYYVTEDGQEFEYLEAAEQHEKLMKIKQAGVNVDLPAEINFYYVQNIEEIEAIMGDDFVNGNTEEINEYNYPCWVGIETINSYGYGDEYFLTNLSDVKDKCEKYFEMYQAMVNKVEG